MNSFINPWYMLNSPCSRDVFYANKHPIPYRGCEIHGQISSVIVVIDGTVVTQRVTVNNAKQYIDRYVDGQMSPYELEAMQKCVLKTKQKRHKL